MKRIAIVTFHRAMNCGAMLQAYALQEVLRKKHNAVILDYRCEELEYVYGYKKNFKKHLRCLGKFFLKHNSWVQETKRFRLFVEFSDKYFVKSARYNSKNVVDANEKFDIFIAGSDQIWNPKWSNEDWNYYLNFADSLKRYSYAASFGGDTIDNKYKVQITKYLKTFQSILLREYSGLNLLKILDVHNRNVGVVCDPVFLLSKNEWLKRFNLNPSKKGYIFLYFATNQTNSVQLAKKLAKKMGEKVIFYNSFATKNIDESFENCIAAGPSEFLSLIYNADLVISTSFHALAFSLIFNVPFIYELNKEEKNNNSRLENLATIFKIKGRELQSVDDIEYEEINWDRINACLEKYKSDSEKALFESIH